MNKNPELQDMDFRQALDFSIIIPIYNEEENIAELYRRLANVMEKLGAYEINHG